MANLQIVPADKGVRPQYVELKVPLYSHGCENKVKKALSQLRGIHSVHVDYDLQKVTVWGICNKYDVLATIRKRRRQARFWDLQADDKSKEEEEEEITEVVHVDDKAAKWTRTKGSSFLRVMSWKKMSWTKRLSPFVKS